MNNHRVRRRAVSPESSPPASATFPSGLAPPRRRRQSKSRRSGRTYAHMLRSRSRLLGNLGLVLILGLFLGFLFPNNDVHVHLPMVSRYQAPRNLLLSISNQHRHGRIAVSEPILVNISQTPDFDGLEMDMHNIHRRVILDDSYDEADGVVKFHAWHWGHKSNHYYAFDDDITRNTYFNYPAEQDEQGHLSPLFHERHCRRVAWHRDLHINCNNFHEFDRSNQLLTHQISFLGKGTYRETFKASDPLGTGFVYKTLKYGRINDGDDDNSYSHKDLEYMRLDALVPDIFTSNRYFVDIYGFCGGSHFSELMPWGDLDGIPQVYGKFHRDVVYEQKLAHSESVALHMNDDLTPSNKLQIALEMATALAYMHNYAGGVIVHDDIWLAQFLPVQDWSKGVPMDADQYIKMNDWNRAEIMLYDEENHEYCDYINGQRVDDCRPPEEYRNEPRNDRIDIFSVGVNFYHLITGMGLFPDKAEDTEDIIELVLKGEKPFVHPKILERSFAERRLTEIMLLCLEYDQHKRIGAGELVQLLRAAVEEDKRQRGRP